MLGLSLGRRRSANRIRSSATRWVAQVEAMEERCLLAGNNLVNVQAQFNAPPVHHFLVTSVPEDPNNTGIITTSPPVVTIIGHVVGPGEHAHQRHSHDASD